VISSSTSRTLAMCATVKAFPYGSKFVFGILPISAPASLPGAHCHRFISSIRII
jgi:hypothetical protein